MMCGAASSPVSNNLRKRRLARIDIRSDMRKSSPPDAVIALDRYSRSNRCPTRWRPNVDLADGWRRLLATIDAD